VVSTTNTGFLDCLFLCMAADCVEIKEKVKRYFVIIHI